MTLVIACPSGSERDIARCRTTAGEAGAFVVDWVTDSGNSRVRLAERSARQRVQINGPSTDLLAACVTAYIADECISRKTALDRWSREYHLVLPFSQDSVADPMSGDLAAILRFVSGDRYSIASDSSGRACGFELDPVILDRCDAVCLFSGGVDSLAGAITLLDEGKKLCLVSHYADSLTAAVHDGLRTRLQELYPQMIDYRPCFVRGKRPDNQQTFPLPRKAENSHRVRSMLFLALAAVYAELYQVSDIFLPENGIIGLNVPLDSSRIGSLSTRTAHPSLLASFSDLLSKLNQTPMRIRNPFALLSKLEIVASLPNTTHQLLLDTHSCAKYDMIRWTGNSTVRHCGYCLPCVYRRLAFAGIGIDNRNDYVVDVFQDLDKLSHNKTRDLRCLSSFLLAFMNHTNAKKQTLMMSNGRVPFSQLPELVGKQKVTVSDFIDMYDRYADKALELLGSLCSSSVRKSLGL